MRKEKQLEFPFAVKTEKEIAEEFEKTKGKGIPDEEIQKQIEAKKRAENAYKKFKEFGERL